MKPQDILPILKEYDETSRFRFNATKVFLTYPNLPENLTAERAHLLLSQKAEIRYYLISQEKHKNGRFHIHAYIQFKTKIDTKSVNFFDLTFYGRRHPNIQKPRSFHKLARYIKKDGNYITNYPNNAEPQWIQTLEITDRLEFIQELLWNIGDKHTSSAYVALMKEAHQLTWEDFVTMEHFKVAEENRKLKKSLDEWLTMRGIDVDHTGRVIKK